MKKKMKSASKKPLASRKRCEIRVNKAFFRKTECDDLESGPEANFHAAAFKLLTRVVDFDGTDEASLDWPAVSNLFYELETAFDPSFYRTKKTRRMTGTGQADYQNNVDALFATRQAKLAKTLWTCDSGLAKRYAALLRDVKKPLGLSDVDKRISFLQEIGRQEYVDPAEALEPIETLEPVIPRKKKERREPFSEPSQRKFANLWNAAQNVSGRHPPMRDFIANHRKAMDEIEVEDTYDGKRILDSARHRGLINKSYSFRNKHVKKTRRKNNGKAGQ